MKKYQRPAAWIAFIVAGSVGFYFGGWVGLLAGLVSVPVIALTGMLAGAGVCLVLALVCGCVGWLFGDDTAFEGW